MLDRRDLLKLGGATVGVGLVAGFGSAQDETTTGTPTGTPTGTTTAEGTPTAPPEGELFAAARLTGAAQEPEPVDTSATGAAVFTQTDEGLAYELHVADIENVTMAHIHIGGPGEAGPVAQWLYPGPAATEPDPIEGQFAGLLAADTITGDNLTGPLEGESLDALVSEIEAGNAYVNVHTEANPAGEIRGQLVAVQAPVGTPVGTETGTTEAGTETETEMGAETEMGTETGTEIGTETNSTAGGTDTPEY